MASTFSVHLRWDASAIAANSRSSVASAPYGPACFARQAHGAARVHVPDASPAHRLHRSGGVLFAGGAVSLDHAATAHRETSAAVAVFCLLNLSAMLAPRLSDWYGAQREGSVDRHRLSISETGRALARITAPNTSRRTSPRNATCCRGCAFGRVRLVLGPDRSSRARESGT